MMKVYIHNMSAVSCIGNDWDNIWRALLECKPLVSTYAHTGTCLTSEPLTSRPAPFEDRVELKDGLLYGKASRLAMYCASQTLCDVPFEKDIFFYGGSTHNEADILMLYNAIEKTGKNVDFSREVLNKNLAIETIPTALIKYLHRPLQVFAWIHSSCVSSLHALMIAATNAQANENATHFVLGVDAMNDIEVAGFNKVGGITKTYCQPFNTARDGILIGEGAAGLILSNDQPSAISIRGLGIGCDAGDSTAPNGQGLELAIAAALRQAGIQGHELGSIVLHGTGTKINDDVEAAVVSKCTDNVPIPSTSVKGVLGHTMGAAGLFNVLVAATALQKGLLPPTLMQGGELLPGLDIVTQSPRTIDKTKPALVLASGFGGNNTAVILKYEQL